MASETVIERPDNWEEIARRIKKRDKYSCRNCEAENRSKGFRDEAGRFIHCTSGSIVRAGYVGLAPRIRTSTLDLQLFQIRVKIVQVDPNQGWIDENLICLCQDCIGDRGEG